MRTVSLELPEEVSADEARLYLAIKLVEAGRVSAGKGAEMAGYSKAAFLELLAKHGVPSFDFAPSDRDAFRR